MFGTSVLANQDAFALASKSNEVACLPSPHTLKRATSECKKRIGPWLAVVTVRWLVLIRCEKKNIAGWLADKPAEQSITYISFLIFEIMNEYECIIGTS